jgi:colanic acid/amylovoran biosynthesis protein
MNILIINVHSDANAGDAALTQVMIDQIRERFGTETMITLVMDDPESFSGTQTAVSSFFPWLKTETEAGSARWFYLRLAGLIPATVLPIFFYRLLKRKFFGLTPPFLRPMLAAYLDADLVLSKAGGFLYSSGRGIILVLQLYTLVLAWMADKPFYLFPQSIGPLRKKWECRMLRWVLRKARLVMVREPVSLQQLTQCHSNHPQPILLPDIAFNFTAATNQEADSWLAEHLLVIPEKSPILGMTLINWSGQNRSFERQQIYEQACASAARHFVQQTSGKVIFFPQVCGPLYVQDDRVPARRVAALLAESSRDAGLVFDMPVPPAILKALYRKASIFIGTRMHSNIFALAESVPVLAIGYQHKTLGIMDLLGLSEWAIDINQVTPEKLVQMLDRLLISQMQVKFNLTQRLPEIQRQAGKAIHLTADDYYSLAKNRQQP